MNIISLENISKTFGSHLAVNDLTLMVPKGSIYGFIGPNGSGKTTTIRMIMNILYPDSDPQEILSAIISRAKVTKFEITSPSLNDIFIRIARPEKNNNHE